MTLGDVIQDFADDPVFALVPGEFRVVLMGREQLAVKRECNFEHLRAHGL